MTDFIRAGIILDFLQDGDSTAFIIGGSANGIL
jgi:hypothetical protein